MIKVGVDGGLIQQIVEEFRFHLILIGLSVPFSWIILVAENWLLRGLTDAAFEVEWQTFLVMGGGYVVAALGSTAFQFWLNRFDTTMQTWMTTSIRLRVTQAILESHNLSVESGKAHSLINNESQTVANAAVALAGLVPNFVGAVVLYGCLLKLSLVAGIAACASQLVSLGVIGWWSKRIRDVQKARAVASGDANVAISDAIQNVPLVQVFGRYSQVAARYRARYRHRVSREVRAIAIQSLSSITSSLVSGDLQVLIYFLLALDILRGSIGPGAFVAFMQMLLLAKQFPDRVKASWVTIQQGLASEQQLIQLVQEVAPTRASRAPVPVSKPATPTAVCKDVTYRYPGSGGGVRGVSFAATAGDVVIVEGENGSGKTTLMKILSGLLQPQSGHASVCGYEIGEATGETIRSLVVWTEKEPFIFQGTVEENIRFGNPVATQEEFRQACALAGVDSFVRELPDGYQHVILEGGSNLSGGQRQRIGLARAILRNKGVVLLDEAFSELDAATVAAVWPKVVAWGQEKVLVVTSHQGLPETTRALRVRLEAGGESPDSAPVESNESLHEVRG